MKQIIQIIVISFLMATLGCSSSGITTQQQLQQLKLGMTKQEVYQMLGEPSSHSNMETLTGKFDTWSYSRELLIGRIQGGGNAFLYGMAKGSDMAGYQPPLILTFQDGKLAQISNR